MKKYLLIFVVLFLSFSSNSEEFVHARKDTAEVIIEANGQLQSCVIKDTFTKQEEKQIEQFILDMNENAHFYFNIDYNFINIHQKQSKEFYLKHYPDNDKLCKDLKSHLAQILSTTESFIFEQLYIKIKYMDKKDYSKLNSDYLYKNGFLSSKFKNYSAGLNQNGIPWIGKIMDIKECRNKEIQTQNTLIPFYCDNGYAKTLINFTYENNNQSIK